jgi:hypothetical protein
MQKYFVIHEYGEPSSRFFKSIADDYTIYHANAAYSARNTQINSKEFVTKNCGHSLVNFLTYIVDNYNSLPDKIIFVKNNILTRHINEEYFLKAIENDFYTPLYNDPNYPIRSKSGHFLMPGYFLESNTSWYVWESTHRYFLSYNDMLDFLFIDARHPEYCAFAPGGCYIVTRQQLLNYPLTFYQALIKIIDYDFFTSEAWILERMLHTIYSGVYDLKSYLFEYDAFLFELSKLPDLTLSANKSKGLKSRVFKKFKLL